MASGQSWPVNFVVQIYGADHASWQGTILWTQSGKKEAFRSALELIRLIDSTVCTPDEPEDGAP